MTILIYDTVGTSNFMTLFRDHADPKLFYFIPQFSQIAKFPDGRLKFGARMFRVPSDPNGGFSIYNFSCSGVVPTEELKRARADLEAQFGTGVRISAITPDAVAPSLMPITEGVYENIRCSSRGIDLFSDLACSFKVPGFLEPSMKGLMQTPAGWTGHIDFSVRTKKTSFDWRIEANWHRIQEHFKAQVSVRKWFVRGNLSYETQKLIQNESLRIDITGGSPEQKEKIYTFAEKIAARLFVPTLEMNPMPSHPGGGRVALSVNYQRIEEDKRTVWSGRESDFEVKPLGLAVIIGSIPNEYFSGYDKTILTGDAEQDHWIYDYVSADEAEKNRYEEVHG